MRFSVCPNTALGKSNRAIENATRTHMASAPPKPASTIPARKALRDGWACRRRESPRSWRERKELEFLTMPTVAKKATPRATNSTDAVSHLADVTDRIQGLLMDRADALMGCTENSPAEAELATLPAVIEANERQRWPQGRI